MDAGLTEFLVGSGGRDRKKTTTIRKHSFV
jgi:hypothetical protein